MGRLHFLFSHKHRKTLLTGIAVANVLYCIGTLFLVIYHSSTLTLLGTAYFLAEIIVILVLVHFERKALRSLQHIA